MSHYVSNNNVDINVSNKECSNIDLKLRERKKITRERKKVPFINFCVQSSRANPNIYPETYCLFAKALSLKCIPFRVIILIDLECNPF